MQYSLIINWAYYLLLLYLLNSPTFLELTQVRPDPHTTAAAAATATTTTAACNFSLTGQFICSDSRLDRVSQKWILGN